ncbi:hypothetical protein BDFB_011637 [Asbolus verrucosus]|uniref:Uncharacterized protein n=1 Tax=Asbolus verrucosus TaxID=1661398 RepID=A0A482VEX0_ASBVE|nr:hypothetical protein BDFB_011637 [Asbolus verrucosus]
MEHKKYGVKTQLIKEFKRFQISVRDRHLRKMPPFIGNGNVWINGDIATCRIEALNGILSVTPFPLMPQGLIGFQLPQQTLIHINIQSVLIVLHPDMRVTLIFDTPTEKDEFTTQLGELNLSWRPVNSSSSADSSPSLGLDPSTVSNLPREV